MNAELVTALLAEGPRLEPGHVWLAGAGPGAPGMLTLDVAAALGQADVIVYDALVNERVLALAANAELVFAGKRGGKPSPSQDDISLKLVELARAGRRVLRLKGGDPFVFGRGGEEALVLAAAGIPFRILPGLTSALGALAEAGIPVTQRGISRAITFATGHALGEADDVDWAALARTGEPIVVYMGLKNLTGIAAALMAGGLHGDTPAAVIASATTSGRNIVVASLDTIAERVRAAGLEAPALIVVGGIVAMRERLGMDVPRAQTT